MPARCPPTLGQGGFRYPVVPGYLRLGGADGFNFNSRAHFYSAAAEAMRRILVDSARRPWPLAKVWLYEHIEKNS